MDAFSDLAFFALLHKHGSLAAAAQQLGVTPPAVSKRLAAVERRLGVRLLQRPRVDQPFRVGDLVRVEDVFGHVETVGLRSTRRSRRWRSP